MYEIPKDQIYEKQDEVEPHSPSGLTSIAQINQDTLSKGFSKAVTSQVCSSNSTRPPIAAGAWLNLTYNIWEVAAWEIAPLGGCQLGSCRWEKGFSKVHNTVAKI